VTQCSIATLKLLEKPPGFYNAIYYYTLLSLICRNGRSLGPFPINADESPGCVAKNPGGMSWT
jgi:hypothetical protein